MNAREHRRREFVAAAVDGYLARNRPGDALKLIADEPDEPWVLGLRGDVAYHCGDNETARALYRRALDGGLANVALRLGNILADAGDVEGAIAIYRDAADAGDPIGWRNAALTIEEIDRPAAEEYFRRAARDGDSRSLLLLGELLLDSGRADAAMNVLEEALDAGQGEAATALAVAHRERGNHQAAEIVLRRGLELGPPCVVAPYLGALLTDLSRPEEAERIYRAVLEIDSECADVLLNLANILSERDDEDAVREAEGFYRKAAKLGLVEAFNNLGVLLLQQGRVAEARASFRRGADRGDELARRRLKDIGDDL